MNIKGNFVTLRAMTKADMQLVCDMFNDAEMEDKVVGWAFPISIEQQHAWFDANMGDQKNFRFVIETETDGAVGIATLTNIDWKNRHAAHGIKLKDTDFRTKGIGTDTVMAISRYAFDELGLHRLNGLWFDDNVASKRLYMKCGWKEEGRYKDYIFKRGKWRDLIPAALLAEDYYRLIEENHYWEK